MRFVFIFVALLCPNLAKAASCPEILRGTVKNLPLCPEGSGPTLISENFPLGAIVITDASRLKNRDSNFASELVLKVLRGAGENTPGIILPVSAATLVKIKSLIDAEPISEAQKEKWKEALLPTASNSLEHTWQQDYMQPFINPKTGKIVIRPVKDYARSGNLFSNVASAVKGCGVTSGKPLETSDIVSGNFGGNIETLPAGVCVIGDDSFASDAVYKKYADQVCGKNPGDRIKVPTSWLRIGHTDEILKVVRNKTRPAPCDFSVILASPEKGIELLKKNPQGSFLDFIPSGEQNKEEFLSKRFLQHGPLREVCYFINDLKKNSDPKKEVPKTNKDRGVASSFDFDCRGITNGDFLKYYNDDRIELKKSNELIQVEMNKLKAEIQSKLKKKLPTCETDFIDAPDVFFTGKPVQKDSTDTELPKRMAQSFLPNPTNGISVNDTFISPEPSNSLFKKYLEDEYHKRGIKTDYIDTFEFAHAGNGNLHCITNTFHTCSPRNSK